MHVIRLLVPLLRAPDVHIIKPPLPDAKVGVIVNAGRQRYPGEHLLAPRILKIMTQVLEDELGRAFLQSLHNLRGVGAVGGPEQEVTVLRHENVSDDAEAELASQVGERGDEPVRFAQGRFCA